MLICEQCYFVNLHLIKIVEYFYVTVKLKKKKKQTKLQASILVQKEKRITSLPFVDVVYHPVVEKRTA